MIASLHKVSKSYGRDPAVHALRNVTFAFPDQQRVLIVGRSGSGKSTLAKCLAGWEHPDEGRIELFCDTRPQLIPQEPASSLNPYWNALAIVAEPFRIRGMGKRQANQLAGEWLRRVEIPADSGGKLSGEFSGGEQARLAIARGLAALEHAALKQDRDRPGLLIFDESFSALHEELREKILGLLMSLQEQYPVTYAFISHDLSIVGKFADFIAVMDSGSLVESGRATDLLSAPQSAALKRLLSHTEASA